MSGPCGDCGSPPPCSDVPASDMPADVLSVYEATPEDVIARSTGVWSGRYPGGDAYAAFDITVEVHEDTETSPPSEPRYWRARGEAATLDDHLECAQLDVPLVVTVTADMPEFSQEWSGVHVQGWQLSDEEPSSTYQVPRNQAYAGREILDEGVPGHAEFFLVFGADGTLWMSAQQQGLAFEASGTRQ